MYKIKSMMNGLRSSIPILGIPMCETNPHCNCDHGTWHDAYGKHLSFETENDSS